MKIISVKEWQDLYNNGNYTDKDFEIIRETWTGSPFSDDQFLEKLKPLADIIRQMKDLKDGGQVNLNDHSVEISDFYVMDNSLKCGSIDFIGMSGRHERDIMINIVVTDNEFRVYYPQSSWKEPIFVFGTQEDLLAWLN